MSQLYMWCSICEKVTEHLRTEGSKNVMCLNGKGHPPGQSVIRQERAEARVPNVFPKGRGF